MRIPMIRFGKDDRPFAAWEFLFAPLMLPLILLASCVAAVVSLPAESLCRTRLQRAERNLRCRLAEIGRFMEWADVESNLNRGHGTLIIEHCSPNGPIREWWTADDLIGNAPIPLPSSLKLPSAEDARHRLGDFARACSARYVDFESGTAKLTDVAVGSPKRRCPSKYVVVYLGDGVMSPIALVTDRKLAERYPLAKVVTLIAWLREPIVAAGDAECVFLEGRTTR